MDNEREELRYKAAQNDFELSGFKRKMLISLTLVLLTSEIRLVPHFVEKFILHFQWSKIIIMI